jgi:hypothetical protein
MIVSTDTSEIKDPNKFGELLREYFFTKDKGRGCYQNFELEPFMIKGAVTPYVQSFFGDCDSTIHFYATRDNLNIWCAYQWDGDGSLIVCDGERIAVNHDCKKDYNWRFVL